MIIEFFRRGAGGSSGPIGYLLGLDFDREYAKILSGDLEEVAELIDSSPYVKKYTAGCLSFYENDLSDSKKKALIAAFEKTLFPGLTPDNYRILWVEHRDKVNEETGQRRLELNFLIPNIEITTGKRLQPFFAKADLQRVDDFKTIVNHKYQLFDPDDPINRRSVKIAKNLPKDKKDFISALNIEVTLAITEGLVSDRESLKSWMTDIGLEITRITKNQISVKNPNNPEGKPIPLKGEFYEQNFRHSEQSAELKREASERYRQEADSRYANCIKRYKKLCESKSEYHLERYATRDRTDSTELTRQLESQKNNPANQHRQDGEERERGRAEDARELTDSNAELEKGLADIKRIEPSHSRASEAEKSPFFIEYSPSFNITYFAYFEHLSKLRQQEQIQRYKRDAEESRVSKIERREHEYPDLRERSMYSDRHGKTDVSRWIQSSERDKLNDIRSAVIENLRRTATAIEATTARARESTAAYSTAITDNRAVKELHANFKREAQRSSADRSEVSADRATAIRADYLNNLVTDLTRQFESTVTSTIERFSAELADREPSQNFNSEHSAEYGASRDRRAIEANGTTDERKVRLGEQLSRKISGFSTGNIFTALKELEQRKELERKNDRGYDSPSPF